MKRILYVENDLITALVMERLFQDTYQIVHVTNGETCLEILATGKFDLVMMDMDLGPGRMNGIETLQAIRTQPATAQVPVIALTGYPFGKGEEKFLLEGFAGYISKPFDWASLPEKIDQYCAR